MKSQATEHCQGEGGVFLASLCLLVAASILFLGPHHYKPVWPVLTTAGLIHLSHEPG